MSTIKKLKEEYMGEWLAIEVTKEKKDKPIEGKLLAIGKDREEILKKAPPKKDKLIYITFAGPPLKKGYAAVF